MPLRSLLTPSFYRWDFIEICDMTTQFRRLDIEVGDRRFPFPSKRDPRFMSLSINLERYHMAISANERAFFERLGIRVAELRRTQNIRSILMLRGQRAILDAELAALYGVATKVLNQAVKRNAERFPEDFVFRLTRIETAKASRPQISAVRLHRTRRHHGRHRPQQSSRRGDRPSRPRMKVPKSRGYCIPTKLRLSRR
jgi:hypothetical protein